MTDQTLHIDIETYSSVDLKTSGVYAYAASPDFQILMVAYALNDGEVTMVDLAAGQELPTAFKRALTDPRIRKTAHNANFERTCFRAAGLDSPVDQWQCTMVLAAYCGLPLSLGGASRALKLGDEAKDAQGKKLVRYFTMPCKPTKRNGQRTRNDHTTDPQMWDDFKAYCVQDVVAERAIHARLHGYTVPLFEHRAWFLDQKINDRGIRIDLELARAAIELNEVSSELMRQTMSDITGLDNPNSVAQLKEWLSDELDHEVTSLAKDLLPELAELAEDDRVTEVIELRQQSSKTSVKKYQAMLACAGTDSRARGLFQFYGANRTGRFSGRLIQLQNLPRNTLSDLDLARHLVKTCDHETLTMFYDNIPTVLSELIRTAFVPSEGAIFAVADFSAIEARVLSWLAHSQWRLDIFRTHGKIYEASASKMFGVPIEQVTKDSDYRQKGKVAELALGYQGGVNALRAMGADRMGLSETEMSEIVRTWRGANPEIVNYWEFIQRMVCATLSSKRPEVWVDAGRCKLNYDGKNLRIKLPSGRCLFYHNPRLRADRFGGMTMVYKGQDKGAWYDIDTYGGKLTENIVQAIARDVLTFAMARLDERGYDIVMHVHDEVVCEVPVQGAPETLEDICQTMAIAPEWAKDMPNRADGFLTTYYKKD